ncbi:hypothetical protein BU202_03695 [Streptococcus cuniculi]|uniref:Exosortase n=1 Tax=Streptococcus cuniculi TaxID=1432788 RepID=A0A1Q8E8J6_9STRE|nr:hypothetical protein [Streptococcus cuniculi]OLF48106.1 hypothetical protein BU202_03695 [Streptococcus cuniculi]
MKILKRDSLFLCLIAFMYIGFQFLIPYLSSNELVQKAHYVNLVVLYIPLVVFLTSFAYGVRFGFHIRYALYVFLLFPLTIVLFQEWIFLYQVAYTLFALLGNGIGHLIYRLKR